MTENDFVIILSHNPNTVGRLVKHGYIFDLMFLRAHPRRAGKYSAYRTPFVPVNDRRFVAGLHKISFGYVSLSYTCTNRGIEMVLSMRFSCLPEITLLEIA